MIRRSFRRGLTLGLLFGAIATAVKAIQSRRTAAPAATPTWPPMPDTTPVVVPEAAVTDPQPLRHEAPAPQPAPEPMPEPATAPAPVPPPPADPAPASVTPAAKKAAAKKAPAKKAAKKAAALAPWVEPTGGECPGTHPVKGKLSSLIFHVPGGFNYPRTRPDRCYIDAAAAEADGLRPSKR